jgi:heme exporter protein B
MNPLAAILMRDMRLAVRVGGGAFMGALFFLIVITMTPFAVGPDLALLARIGPAILWLGALLGVCWRSIVCLRPTMTMDRLIFL